MVLAYRVRLDQEPPQHKLLRSMGRGYRHPRVLVRFLLKPQPLMGLAIFIRMGPVFSLHNLQRLMARVFPPRLEPERCRHKARRLTGRASLRPLALEF
jgi:hypothetical protein